MRTRTPPPTAVAIVTDHRDGTYALKFKTTPFHRHPSNLSGIGLLTINLQFTCGIGSMPYPSKANWTSSGRTHQKLTIENVPQPSLQYYTQPSLPDLSNYRIVDFFGDSIIRMMVTADGEWVPKRHRKYYKQNVFFSNNVRSHLTNETVEHLRQVELKCARYGHRVQNLVSRKRHFNFFAPIDRSPTKLTTSTILVHHTHTSDVTNQIEAGYSIIYKQLNFYRSI